MESIPEPDFGDPEDSVNFFDIPFDLRDQVLCRPDPPRIQRGPQGSGQSTGDGGNDVIEGCRVLGAGQLLSVFVLIETFDPPMYPKLDGIREWLHAGGSVRTFMLFDAYATGVGYGHDTSPGFRPPTSSVETHSKRYPSQARHQPSGKTASVYRKIRKHQVGIHNALRPQREYLVRAFKGERLALC
jgi:hypothetical protein